jgi:hypothetical protein
MPATLPGVRGRPITASALSMEINDDIGFAGNQLKEAGTAANSRPVPTEAARRPNLVMIISKV